MVVAILQTILAVLAGYGVFAAWRRLGARSRPIYWIVAFGIAVRAVGGALAFWISYLALPVGRSMQIGRGLWIFALDSKGYFNRAILAAQEGPLAIIHMPKTESSVFYVQSLATTLMLFGSIASAAVLLNIIAYVACCATVLSFGRPANDRTVIAAIAALSVSPSAIMWSVQPLKDGLFLCLVTLFFASAFAWQQLWSSQGGAGRRAGLAALLTVLMFAFVYAISGIRWYFGMVIVGAAIPFVLLVIGRARTRMAATIAAALLVPVLGLAFLTGGGPYVPVAIRDAVLGKKKPALITTAMVRTVKESREAFDRMPSATMIGAGGAIRKIDRSLDEKKPAQSAPPEPAPQTPKPVIEKKAPEKAAAAKPKPVPKSPAAESQPPVKTVAEQPKPPAHSVVATAEPKPAPKSTPAEQHPATTSSVPSHPKPAVASVAPETKPASHAVTTAEPKPAPKVTALPPTVAAAEQKAPAKRPKAAARKAPVKPAPATVASQPQPAPVPAPIPAPAPAATAPAASPAVVEGGTTQGTVVMPESPVARFLAGTAAIILPRAVAQWLGLLQVQGGRGVWLVVEIDTIIFDIVLVLSFISILRALRQRGYRSPIFWMMLIVTGVIAAALAYTVSNFGTLFRHRDMVLLCIVLLPIAMWHSSAEPKPQAQPDSAEA